jgi:hypothetical protein
MANRSDGHVSVRDTNWIGLMKQIYWSPKCRILSDAKWSFEYLYRLYLLNLKASYSAQD